MRIGIDASRAFIDKRTGTEEYSYQTIKHLLQLPVATKHQWILYIKSQAKIDIKIPSELQHKVQIIQINYPYLWTQLGLALRTWIDKLDVLWIPAHTLPVLRKPGLKTIVTIHGIEYEWLPAYENPIQRVYLPLSTQYVVESANRIIAVSMFTKMQLIERLHADPAKIIVAYEGIDPNLLMAPVFTKESMSVEKNILAEYKLSKRGYLLFIGTVQPRKNLIRLMEAFAQLADKSLKLVLVGKLGWMYEDIVKTPKRLGIVSRIVLVGYINNADRYTLLANAVVYVQPSVTEGFGLPVLEAMSQGVPVVSSNGGALAEVVGNAGLLFDPLSITDIKEKLDRVLSDGVLRKLLIDRGFKRVADFGWQKTAQETLNILEQL